MPPTHVHVHSPLDSPAASLDGGPGGPEMSSSSKAHRDSVWDLRLMKSSSFSTGFDASVALKNNFYLGLNIREWRMKSNTAFQIHWMR